VETEEGSVILAEGVVEAQEVDVVVLERLVRQCEVVAAVGCALDVRQRVQIRERAAERIDAIGRNDIAGERAALEPAVRSFAGRSGVVDLVRGAEPQQVGEVAIALRERRDGAVPLNRNAERVRFVGVEPERAVLAGVEVWDAEWAADRPAVTVVLIDRLRRAVLVVEEVRRVERLVAEEVVQLAVVWPMLAS
jgi:hypothetical protein